MEAADAPPVPAPQRQAAIYFGLSCALAARVAGCDLGAKQCRWSRARELSLQEKVSELEVQVGELRRRRAEDARANEKVAGIFAAHEQRWFEDRKALRRQVQAVVTAARARELRHDEAAAELRRQLEDQQSAVELKNDAVEQDIKRREEVLEKLRVSEQAGEELRERARKDAQERAADLRKHKSAFVEAVSSQRQLEAELCRAGRRAESAEEELKAAKERRDAAVATAAEHSVEAAQLRRDAEHKDKILSAMLRKSKIDMEDREMLVREVKMCKARRKQVELEADRWRKMWESRHRRGSRSLERCHQGCSDKVAGTHAAGFAHHDTKILFVNHVEAEVKKERQAVAPVAKDPTNVECVDRYPSHVHDKTIVQEYQDLQEWFHKETGKCTTMMRHRHSAETEAFTEQLRLKDEKLEAFRWRVVSMDAEVARLRCRVQELERRLSRNEQHGAGHEALLLDKQNLNTSLKEQLASTLRPEGAVDLETSPPASDDDEGGKNTCEHCTPCSRVKIQGTDRSGEDTGLPPAAQDENHAEITRLNKSVPIDDCMLFGAEATEAYNVSVLMNDDTFVAARRSVDDNDRRRNGPTDRSSYRSEIEEEKEVSSQEATPEQKPSARRTVDIHALAVSYKIKRLKQQLLVLEKLAAAAGDAGTMTSNGDASCSSRYQQQRRNYQLMISFVSKHVKRYQSLEDMIDDLSTRMEESRRSGGRQGGGGQQSETLGRFLEETFQLQRYMVATGQKLLEIQSRVATSLARGGTDGNGGGDGVDTGRFMDVVGALLRDVQRGLEVRIARIIGDLEGTLTFHGILQTTF